MTPREPSAAAINEALNVFFDATDWRNVVLPADHALEWACMKGALRAAYAVDATEGRDG